MSPPLGNAGKPARCTPTPRRRPIGGRFGIATVAKDASRLRLKVSAMNPPEIAVVLAWKGKEPHQPGAKAIGKGRDNLPPSACRVGNVIARFETLSAHGCLGASAVVGTGGALRHSSPSSTTRQDDHAGAVGRTFGVGAGRGVRVARGVGVNVAVGGGVSRCGGSVG